MAINSKSDICNLALGHLGNYGTVSDIDTPTNDKERTFALWYDITRQTTLKLLMPNFSLARKATSKVIGLDDVGSGYEFAYEYPVDCLKLLGVGDIDLKDLSISVETSGGSTRIFTDIDYTDGMPIRYIKDISIVTAMSPEYKMYLSFELAANVAVAITQDPAKAAMIIKQLPGKMASLSALNAQENPPIRINNSKFKAARFGALSHNPSKL